MKFTFIIGCGCTRVEVSFEGKYTELMRSAAFMQDVVDAVRTVMRERCQQKKNREQKL